MFCSHYIYSVSRGILSGEFPGGLRAGEVRESTYAKRSEVRTPSGLAPRGTGARSEPTPRIGRMETRVVPPMAA